MFVFKILAFSSHYNNIKFYDESICDIICQTKYANKLQSMMRIIFYLPLIPQYMLKDILLSSGAIKIGDFVLTSGKKSSYYVDIKEAATDPMVLKAISEEIAKKITAGKIAGMELGAVPLIVSVSILKSIPYVILRKSITHGTKKLTVGKIDTGETIDMVEDVVTTGNSLLKAVNLIRENGGIVKRAICVVDRMDGGSELLKENGVELVPLLKISDLEHIN